MNYAMIARILARVMGLEAVLLVPPVIVALIYGESPVSFLITMLIVAVVAVLFNFVKVRNKDIYAREGFVSVGLSWLLMSLLGALPFLFSGEIPNYIDAFFETASGFSTTGASLLTNVEAMSRSHLFWRSLTQWIGGMGVLVFIMAVLPLSEDHSMHIMRAEVPGPIVGKLVPRVRSSSAITYIIYIALTVGLVIFLCFGGMSLYDALIHSMSAASTGGFSVRALSIGYYDSAYIDIVTAVFMLLFGVNFNVYFLLLMKKYKQALKNTELFIYAGVIVFATVTITANIVHLYDSVGQAARYSFFQVASLVTTTGYGTADFNLWPSYSKCLIVLLMFMGACSGSTGGGMKVSRFIILAKSALANITRQFSPRRTVSVSIDGHRVDDGTIRSTQVYFLLYMSILAAATLLISLDGFDLTANFTAVVSCLSNIGPGLSVVGPMGNYAGFSGLSKIILSLCMLTGRLEIFPMIMLAVPSVWRKA